MEARKDACTPIFILRSDTVMPAFILFHLHAVTVLQLLHSCCRVDLEEQTFFCQWVLQLLAPIGLKLHPFSDTTLVLELHGFPYEGSIKNNSHSTKFKEFTHTSSYLDLFYCQTPY